MISGYGNGGTCGLIRPVWSCASIGTEMGEGRYLVGVDKNCEYS